MPDIPGQFNSDEQLVTRARRGDSNAAAELWRRHAGAGHAFAAAYTRTYEASDLVAEAFAKILAAIRRGGGPDGPFRPYLYVTIKTTAISWHRLHRNERLTEDLDVADDRIGHLPDGVDGGTAMSALRSLPADWQEVLWSVDVEGVAPTEIAAALGLSPNAVSARLYRAREGLRQAWITAELRDRAPMTPHDWVLEQAGAYARDALPPVARRRLQRHLDDCPACALACAEAMAVASRIGYRRSFSETAS